MIKQFHQQHPNERSGTVLVEFALVATLFAMFLAMIVELGHVYVVINSLNSAAKRSARYGIVEGISTAQVKTKATSILGTSLNPGNAVISVLDGSVFDSPGYDADSYDAASLPAIEILGAESRQLFVVRISVDYDDVALFSPFWVKDATLTGQSVIRHE
ncbi:pilus assembly protein [Planctomicrobium sp.]|jgi:hypothetical protein|nr:TadE family protein [Planctomicrobium sp.]MBT5019982.1 pilus assembly protein [Planctomicrobium sp.]MDB4733227.1 pilus assembly protein [Planctomicrobium sp.]